MLRRLSLLSAGSVAVLLAAGPARAQGDMMQMARVMFANTMGVMTYCTDKGWGDKDVVAMLQKSATNMPAPSDPAAVASAEETGRKGSMLMNGSPIALSSMASQSNTTEKDVCTRMVTAAKMAASQSAGAGMPGGTAMPSMPSGTTMPAMPGMPAKP